MGIGGDLVFRILADKAQFDRTAQQTRTSIGKLAGKAKSAFAAIAIAYAGAFSIDKADQQAQAEKKLSAVLKATGHAAGFSAKELQSFAAARQDLTNFGDEDTINLAGLLATFKQIKGAVFKETITLAQDMSSVLGTDLKSSAIQLGKALNDPTKGITALSRAGVSFTEGQKEQIKTMQEAGDILGAQGVILAELRSEFGGSAEAMASDWQQLKNELGDTAEFVGAVLMPVVKLLNNSVRFLNDGITAVIDGLKEFLRIGTTAPIQVGSSFKDLRQEYKEQEDSLKNIAELNRIIGDNADLQKEGKSLNRSGARGKGELDRLMNIVGTDLGGERLKMITNLGAEIDKLANPTSRFGAEIDSLYKSLMLLEGAKGIPGVEIMIADVEKLIDDQTGITAAIAKANQEFEELQGLTSEGAQLREFARSGASSASLDEFSRVSIRNKEEEADQSRIADLTIGADDLKSSLDPLIEFDKKTGRIKEIFDEELIDKDQFKGALAQARKEFEASVKVDPEFEETGPRGAGPSGAISSGSQEFNQLIALALTGREDEQKKQTKNLQQVRESNELIAASSERVEQLLRTSTVITKPDGV